MKSLALTPVAAALLLAATACSGGDRKLTVTNPSPFDRTEVAALPLSSAGIDAPFVIIDEEGAELPYSVSADSLVLFLVKVDAGATRTFSLKAGSPSQSPDTVACGAFYPERIDDFAWENDRAAYRAYGPALEARGEHSYGYDVWTKSVAHPVVAERYRKHLSSPVSYHEDHGDGMDVYSVGPTLGGGATALVDSTGALVYPRSFASYEILENGPLRFAVRLTYKPVVFAGDTLVEQRVIRLDAAADLNSTEVRYLGQTRPVTAAAGIVVHASNPEAYTIDSEARMATYADLTDNPEGDNGIIWLGLLAPEADSIVYKPLPEPAAGATGHVLAMRTLAPGEAFTYSWGSGWSKGFVPDSTAWQTLMEQAASEISHPLKISIE